jgi:hypothetical protein
MRKPPTYMPDGVFCHPSCSSFGQYKFAMAGPPPGLIKSKAASPPRSPLMNLHSLFSISL